MNRTLLAWGAAMLLGGCKDRYEPAVESAGEVAKKEETHEEAARRDPRAAEPVRDLVILITATGSSPLIGRSVEASVMQERKAYLLARKIRINPSAEDISWIDTANVQLPGISVVDRCSHSRSS